MNEPRTQTAGERIWRNTFFVLSAVMGALALVDFDAGRFPHGLGDLGASVLTLSLTVQFPFVRAIVKASAEQTSSQAEALKRREQLLQQAAKLRAENPWADRAGRAGWTLLAISLLLRVIGAD
jgi:hypothetical protein